MNRTWAFSCMFALSALLGGCGKDDSHSAAPGAGASASQASSQAASATLAASGAPAASGAQKASAIGVIARTQLPAEAADTLRLIKAGGPYPFSEDGIWFRNSAELLPPHPRNYYHAYTVRTPGAADRGKRRIVCGGPRKQTGECYYTDDYYVTFKRIAE